MWTVFCRSGGGRANVAGAAVDAQMRRARIHADGVCRSDGGRANAAGSNSCGRCFAEAAVDEQMRRVRIHVDGVCRSGGGRANAAGPKKHVDGVLRKRLWARKCGGPTFM